MTNELIQNFNTNSVNIPGFMVLGPQRTGTTWLCECLKSHPQIHFSSPKELYFFNLLKLNNHSLHNSNDFEWYTNHFKVPTKEKIKRAIKNYLKYNISNITLKGEGTASYITLSPEIIELVKKMNPDLKFILIIRDLYERAWSHCYKDLLKPVRKNEAKVSELEMIEFMKSEYQLKCADYRSNLTNWFQHFPKEQFRFYDFNSISNNPKELFKDICNFLKIDFNETILTTTPQLFQMINSNQSKKYINYDISNEILPLIEPLNKDFLLFLKEENLEIRKF